MPDCQIAWRELWNAQHARTTAAQLSRSSLFVHNIQQSKLFVVQTLFEIAELQNCWGSGGSRYVKRISGAQRWILYNKILSVWDCLDSPTVTSVDVVFKAETGLHLSIFSWWIMSYRSQNCCPKQWWLASFMPTNSCSWRSSCHRRNIQATRFATFSCDLWPQ